MIQIDRKMLYSPQQPIAYTRMSEDGYAFGVGAEVSAPERRAWWNLYWLSDPAVDAFLCNQEDWESGPGVNLKLFSAAAKTTHRQKLGGVPISELLVTLPPTEFVTRLKESRHGHLYIAKEAGSRWLEVVDQRARMYRGAIAAKGSILYVSFGRKADDHKVVPKPAGSATVTRLPRKHDKCGSPGNHP